MTLTVCGGPAGGGGGVGPTGPPCLPQARLANKIKKSLNRNTDFIMSSWELESAKPFWDFKKFQTLAESL
jgi:hypothetical protein